MVQKNTLSPSRLNSNKKKTKTHEIKLNDLRILSVCVCVFFLLANDIENSVCLIVWFVSASSRALCTIVLHLNQNRIFSGVEVFFLLVLWLAIVLYVVGKIAEMKWFTDSITTITSLANVVFFRSRIRLSTHINIRSLHSPHLWLHSFCSM